MKSNLNLFDHDLSIFEKTILNAMYFKRTERIETDFKLLDEFSEEDLNENNYLISNDGKLVISFDNGWYPFLCQSRGFNRKDQRWYIPKTSSIISKIGLELQKPLHRFKRDQNGGRIFLCSTGAFTKYSEGKSAPVLTWTISRPSYLLPEVNSELIQEIG
ncbi:MAG: hypothetical protein ACR2GN_05225 [Bacteroidia bacterium]